MEFEWDGNKNKTNFAKHGIDFMLVKPAFDDKRKIVAIDERKNYGEVRYQMLGMAFECLLFIAYTVRGDKVRIISARSASKEEKRIYNEND